MGLFSSSTGIIMGDETVVKKGKPHCSRQKFSVWGHTPVQSLADVR